MPGHALDARESLEPEGEKSHVYGVRDTTVP